MTETMRQLRVYVKRHCDSRYLIDSHLYLAAGIGLSVLFLCFIGFREAMEGGWINVAKPVSGLLLTGAACYAAATFGLGAWKEMLVSPVEQFLMFLRALVVSIFIVAIGWAGVWLLHGSSLLLLLLMLTMAFLHLFAMQLLKVPTAAGRKALKHLAGFQLFLTTGRHSPNFDHHPPERTPELYEKYLPYALALDVEKQWTEQFIHVIPAFKEDGGYLPEWYTSTNARLTNMRGFITMLSSGLTQSIASSTFSANSVLNEEV